MRDLPAEWASPAFLARASGWVRDELGRRGRRLTGDRTVWFKVANPGQGFEPALLSRLSALVPGRVVEPLAVEEGEGWLLMPDGGTTLRDFGPGSGAGRGRRRRTRSIRWLG